MTRDDIIRMARQAGLLNCECCLPFFDEDDHKNWERFFVNFATLVAAAEREACAKVCVHNAELYASPNVGWESSMECAAAIRAKGNEPELEHITYKTAGAVLEEGFYSVDDLQDILKSLEYLNPRGNHA